MSQVLEGENSGSHWSASLISGGLSGLVTLTYSVSYAALIFKGPLLERLDIGIGMALMSAVVVAFVVALKSSFPFAIAGPDSNASAILAVMASAIIAETQTLTQALNSTIVALAVSSLFVGASLFAIGRLKLGYLVRYIPYPVLGGFLAGTGWLITMGGFSVMMGSAPSFGDLAWLTDVNVLRLWTPGLAMAVVMMLVMSRFKHYLVFPALILGAIVLVHVVLVVLGVSMDSAAEMGYLYRPFAREPSPLVWLEFSLSEVQWGLVMSQMGNLVAMTGVVVITILLNASGIELSSEKDADLNRELSSAGVANMVAGCLGGIIGYQSISRSLLNFRAGGTIRPSGMAAAGFCVLFFLGASPLLTAIPKLVLGGLLLYLGLGLLKEWVIQGWTSLSRSDYAMVMAIMLVVATMGFLEGVLFGLVISVILVVMSYSSINVVKLTTTGESHRSSFVRSMVQENMLKEEGGKVLIMNLHGYLFFGTSHSLQEQVKEKLEEEGSRIELVILDFRLVTGLDSSVALSFRKMLQVAIKNETQIFLTDLTLQMESTLKDLNLLGDHEDAFKSSRTLDLCVQRCEDQLLSSRGVDLKSTHRDISDILQEMFLPDYYTEGFVSYLKRTEYKKGDVIVQQGDIGESMYIVAMGQVTAQLELAGGHTIRLIAMGSATIFGEMGLYTTAPRSASVLADEDTVCYELKNDDLEVMQKEDPEMATALHRYIISLLSGRIFLTNRKVRQLS